MKRSRIFGIIAMILSAAVLAVGIIGANLGGGNGPFDHLLQQAQRVEERIAAERKLEKDSATAEKRAAAATTAAAAAIDAAQDAADAIAALNGGLSAGATGDETVDRLYLAASRAQAGIDGAKSALEALESSSAQLIGENGVLPEAIAGITEFVNSAELAARALLSISEDAQGTDEMNALIAAAIADAQAGIEGARSAAAALDSSGRPAMGDDGAFTAAIEGIGSSIAAMELAAAELDEISGGMILDMYRRHYESSFDAVSNAEDALLSAQQSIEPLCANAGLDAYAPAAWLALEEQSFGSAREYSGACELLLARALELEPLAQGALTAAQGASAFIAEMVLGDALTAAEQAVLLLRQNAIGVIFTAGLFAIAGLIMLFAAERFARQWNKNPVFSTMMALLVMLIFQTYALGFGFSSFAEWGGFWVNNAFNVLRANAAVGMVALGMTMVVITGGIDLAVGSTLAGVGTVMMVLMDTSSRGLLGKIGISGIPAYLIGIAAGMGTGLIIGAIIGLVVTKGKVPPFIATLGTMNIVRSVAQYFTKSYTPKIPTEFTAISNTVIFGQRLLPIVYWLALAVIIYIVMKHTAFGRHVYAVGSNERTTRLSGINVNKVKLKVYMLMGFIVSIASITQLARLGNMDVASAGSGYELDAIAAVVVGGTAMSGGKGSVVGTVLGVLIIGIMNNLLILLGVDSFLTNAFKGAIVIFAVLMQRKEKAA